MGVVPATWEAEAGGFPEPQRLRLQGTEIISLDSSLGEKQQQQKNNVWCGGRVVAHSCNPRTLGSQGERIA